MESQSPTEHKSKYLNLNIFLNLCIMGLTRRAEGDLLKAFEMERGTVVEEGGSCRQALKGN